jgi:hypothetical protein
MRTARMLVGTLVGLAALTICSCKESLAPTIKRATEDTSTIPTTPIQPDERETALAVLDRAIKAHGGKTALSRAVNRERDGIGGFGTPPLPFTDHTVLALPDRARMAMEIGSEKEKTRFLMIVNGEHAWKVDSDKTVVEQPRTTVEELTEDRRLLWLTTLTPLEDSRFQLGTTPEIKVDDRPTVGIRIQEKDHPEVFLYFDKDTALLVKARRQAREGGIVVDKEHFFSGYKDFDGVQLPTRERAYMNKNKIFEVEYTSWKVLPKVDEGLFKP